MLPIDICATYLNACLFLQRGSTGTPTGSWDVIKSCSYTFGIWLKIYTSGSVTWLSMKSGKLYPDGKVTLTPVVQFTSWSEPKKLNDAVLPLSASLFCFHTDSVQMN